MDVGGGLCIQPHDLEESPPRPSNTADASEHWGQGLGGSVTAAAERTHFRDGRVAAGTCSGHESQDWSSAPPWLTVSASFAHEGAPLVCPPWTQRHRETLKMSEEQWDPAGGVPRTQRDKLWGLD